MTRAQWQWCGVVLGVFATVSLARAATARGDSLLPLVTERAETLPNGTAEAILGVSYLSDGRFPNFVPAGALERQTVVQGPQLGFHIGVGDWAEFQASYETIYLDEKTTRGQTNTQFGGGDARFYTKFHFVRERDYLPAIGIRFGTKLPDAVRSDRLGTDDTDFGADVLLSKDFGLVSTHVNLGIQLLGNSGPTIGHSFSAGGQDDMFDYNIAVVSAPLGAPLTGATTVRLLAEFTGMTGSRYGNDREAMRAGVQMTRGPGTIYIGSSVGLVTASENIGASAGFIYRFEPAALFGGE